MHDDIRRKILELFKAGVRRVNEFRTLLDAYVRNDLFAGRPAPASSDARFWPSNRHILGCVSRLASKSRYLSSLENLFF